MPSKTLSMTGFGAAEGANKQVSIGIEIRGVNHKFLDVLIKMPKSYGAVEAELKNIISKEVERGRVEVSITRTPLEASALPVSFNQALFDRYLTASTDVMRAYGGLSEETVPALLFNLVTNREFLSIDESRADLKSELPLIKKVLIKALKSFVAMRSTEGAALAKDVAGRIKKISSLLASAAKRAGQTPHEKAKRLQERLGNLEASVTIEPQRLAQEVAIIADRLDVSEEIARIKSHIAQFNEAMSEAPQGRKLDFITQELFREWNTIGSKAQDSALQSLVVEAKVELERLREQIQNIE
jgi:uncharacterized protein (TIGR00255 family)